MFYYRKIGSKDIIYHTMPIGGLSEEWEVLGKHLHPNPKMAVVALVGSNESGFNIKSYESSLLRIL